MFSKRERFERTDVPSSPASGMMLALGALAFIVVGLLVGLRVAKVLSERDISLTDRSLANALASQSDAETPEGYQASSDIYTNVLILTVDDISADNPTLTGVELLSVDVTTNTATAVSVPLNLRVSSEVGDSMIQSMCVGSGTASCVAPFAAASGVHLSHVIITSSDIWAKFDELRGLGTRSLVTSSPEAFSTLRTDMSNDELMDLVDRIGTIGSANIARIDAPVGEGTLEDGTGVSNMDSLQLRLALGLLYPAEAAPAEESSEEAEPAAEEESYDEGYYDGYYDDDYYDEDYYD